MAAGKDFMGDVHKDLNAKIRQIDAGVRQGHVPSGRELEQFGWKTWRVISQLVSPEKSAARKIFWSECKGISKKVLVIENFNAGQFVPQCVREDIFEQDLLATLQRLQTYTKNRQSGVVVTPKAPIDTPERGAGEIHRPSWSQGGEGVGRKGKKARRFRGSEERREL